MGLNEYITLFNLHKFNNKKQVIMRKYFFTMATVALFAIGFSASDEEESSNSSSSSSTPQTEQKQEESILGTYEVTDKVGCTIRR